MNKLIKKSVYVLAALLVIAAIISTLFRALTPFAARYKGKVETQLSQLVGKPVIIGNLTTSWYWFEPVLKLSKVTIKDKAFDSLNLHTLLIGINVFSSLWHWQIQPGVLYVGNVNLSLREQDGHWSLDGLNTNKGDLASLSPQLVAEIVAWIANQNKIIIKRLSLDFYFSDGRVTKLNDVNLSLLNQGGHYQIRGRAKLLQTLPTDVQIMANIDFNPAKWREAQGHIYCDLSQFAITDWRRFFNLSPYKLTGGLASTKLWLDFANGQVQTVSSLLSLKNLSWTLLTEGTPASMIEELQANLLFEHTSDGWQLRADHILLHAENVDWPENQLLLRYLSADNSYQFYIQTILLDTFENVAVKWPVAIQSLLAAKIGGILTGMHVHLKDGSPTYLLGRFDKLQWLPVNNYPGVVNLSGALQWQPQQGRLELDSEKVQLAFNNLPKTEFALISTAIDWQKLAQGIRLGIDRLVLHQADLTMNLLGVLDNLSTDSLGFVRLHGDFSMRNAKQWLAYLPTKFMQPGLVSWLNDDIKRIANISGELSINGNGKDFPFDKSPGEFSIKTYISGLDLNPTTNWPLCRDIEAYLTVNKRNLEAHIVDANLQDVPIKQMHIQIDDLGLNNETLVLHGSIPGQIEKMRDFVMASPLAKKLSVLNLVQLYGPVVLDLNLLIPLAVRRPAQTIGQIDFNRNVVKVLHGFGSVNIDALTGSLHFTENGINHSSLHAALLGYPIEMQIEAKKEGGTLVDLSLETTIEALKSQMNWPPFSFFQGGFAASAQLLVSDSLDKIHAESSLQGLAINLPYPLQKPREALTPSSLDVDLSKQNAINLRLNYANKVSADIDFKKEKNNFKFYAGEILLGSNHASSPTTPGLQIMGKLDHFNWKAWLAALTKVADKPKNSQTDLKFIKRIDVQIAKFDVFNVPMNNLSLQLRALKRGDFAFALRQEDIVADLNYSPTTNTLAGQFTKLHLPALKDLQTTSTMHLQPENIPNINLRIDDFAINSLAIGDITLQGKPSSDHWLLTYGRIKTDAYILDLQGDWQAGPNHSQTHLEAQLRLSDLAKSLQRWQLEPVVEADSGTAYFSGGLPGSYFDFSLAKLHGKLNLALKNGRVTHLSPETEEKLGIGKLLSILSLQTIPRRLKLDFRDLSKKGYSFDDFKGTFVLRKGILKTTDSTVDGPVAFASMQGNLDVVKRLYDIELNISPHITASLPIVATIAGGPVAGIAAWVAGKIINPEVKRITSYTYKISGPWKNPIVQQVKLVGSPLSSSRKQ